MPTFSFIVSILKSPAFILGSVYFASLSSRCTLTVEGENAFVQRGPRVENIVTRVVISCLPSSSVLTTPSTRRQSAKSHSYLIDNNSVQPSTGDQRSRTFLGDEVERTILRLSKGPPRSVRPSPHEQAAAHGGDRLFVAVPNCRHHLATPRNRFYHLSRCFTDNQCVHQSFPRG